MIFKPMVVPKSPRKSSSSSYSLNWGFENIEEARARLGKECAIYEDEAYCDTWRVYFVKDNLLVNTAIKKEIKINK